MNKYIPGISRKARNFFHHAIRHFLKGDFSGWLARISAQVGSPRFLDASAVSNRLHTEWSFGIIASQDGEFVAHFIKCRLELFGWQVKLLADYSNDLVHDWYVLIGTESLVNLPPKNKSILIQPKFLDLLSRDALLYLRGCFAVLASSISSIEYLATHGVVFPQVHYLPIDEVDNDSSKRFAFMFDRFLIAQGFLKASHAVRLELLIPESLGCVGLSLPETFERRRLFERVVPLNCFIFDGMRRWPGWAGCALSYKVLAHHALEHGMHDLMVIEDDVLLPMDFESKMKLVREFLNTIPGNWDVFAGMITTLSPGAEILAVNRYKNVMFVTTNKITGMVCNIYNQSALQILAKWDSENMDAKTNTIDRYLESQEGLRVVAVLPFLVRHRDDVESTLWGASNRLYSEQIGASERELMRKAIEKMQ